jgi:hypothetical protein
MDWGPSCIGYFAADVGYQGRIPAPVVFRQVRLGTRPVAALPSGATFSLWVENFPSAPALGFSFVRSQKQKTPER